VATDVYGRRKMFSSGIVFLFLVPIGGIVLFFLYDFCANIYYQNKLDNETKEVMGAILEREGLENIDEMKEFAIKVFEEYKIDEENFSLTQVDDYYILTAYHRHVSVVWELSFGLLRTKKKTVSSSYKGYYNEYKEAVVEKYVEENLNEDLGNDGDILIK